MKQKNEKTESGFTLIEVIVVLVLMGILAVGLSLGLVRGVENFIFASEATQLSQKAQLALARIQKELTDITPNPASPASNPITTAGVGQIDYRSSSGDTYSMRTSNGQITLARTNNTTTFQQVLIDNVNTASFTYFLGDGIKTWSTANTFSQLAQIRVSITLNYGSGRTMVFQTTVNPRKNETLNTPKLN